MESQQSIITGSRLCRIVVDWLRPAFGLVGDCIVAAIGW